MHAYEVLDARVDAYMLLACTTAVLCPCTLTCTMAMSEVPTRMHAHVHQCTRVCLCMGMREGVRCLVVCARTCTSAMSVVSPSASRDSGWGRDEAYEEPAGELRVEEGAKGWGLCPALGGTAKGRP